MTNNQPDLIVSKMSIQSAIPMGENVFVYDESGRVIFTVPLGNNPDNGLVGCTGSGVSVRRGGVVTTYNERGQAVRSVSLFPSSKFFSDQGSQPRTEPPNRLFLIAAVAALAIGVFSPGLVTVAGLKSLLSLSLETGQMWAFGIACSTAVWVALYLINRDFRKASIRYLVLCAGVIVLFLFCHFGLKTEFTQQTLKLYFPQHR